MSIAIHNKVETIEFAQDIASPSNVLSPLVDS
jgi:hypothetical protein